MAWSLSVDMIWVASIRASSSKSVTRSGTLLTADSVVVVATRCGSPATTPTTAAQATAPSATVTRPAKTGPEQTSIPNGTRQPQRHRQPARTSPAVKKVTETKRRNSNQRVSSLQRSSRKYETTLAARSDVHLRRIGSGLGKPGSDFLRVAYDRDYRGMIVSIHSIKADQAAGDNYPRLLGRVNPFPK